MNLHNFIFQHYGLKQNLDLLCAATIAIYDNPLQCRWWLYDDPLHVPDHEGNKGKKAINTTGRQYLPLIWVLSA